MADSQRVGVRNAIEIQFKEVDNKELIHAAICLYNEMSENDAAYLRSCLSLSAAAKPESLVRDLWTVIRNDPDKERTPTYIRLGMLVGDVLRRNIPDKKQLAVVCNRTASVIESSQFGTPR